MDDISEYPQTIIRRHPTTCVQKIGVPFENITNRYIDVEYIRKDIYTDLLGRVREAYEEMSGKGVLSGDDPGNIYFGMLEIIRRHVPELEEE